MSAGGVGEVLRSNRTIMVGRCRSRGDLFVGRLPAIGRGRVRRAEGDRCGLIGPGPRSGSRPRRGGRAGPPSRPVPRWSHGWGAGHLGRSAGPGRTFRTPRPTGRPRRGPAAGRQGVVGAGRVVARGFGRPRADERGARVAQAGDGRLEGFDVDGEVLGGVGVDEVDGAVEVGARAMRPWSRSAAARISPAGRAGEPARDRRLDGVREPASVVTRMAGESGPCWPG